MIHLTGDLFSTPLRIIAHGVNTRGVMGAGIAAAFRGRWPQMYRDYRDVCQSGELVPGDVFFWTAPDGLVIANMATQDDPGPNARLEWVESAALRVASYTSRLGDVRVALPRIGCGIGGLEWKDVTWTLDRVEDGRFVQFVSYSPA